MAVVTGHMADGIGPEPAVHRTACSWISGPAVVGEEPARSAKITGGLRSASIDGPCRRPLAGAVALCVTLPAHPRGLTQGSVTVEDQELLAAIGKVALDAAALEYLIAVLVAATEGQTEDYARQ